MGHTGVDNFQMSNGLFSSKGVKGGWYEVPAPLRPVLLRYFHDSVLLGHLGGLKTFQKIAGNLY
jgi:hypothetical protein